MARMEIVVVLPADAELVAMAQRQDVLVFTVWVVPEGDDGRYTARVAMPRGSKVAVLFATLALLSELMDLCREQADVPGSAQVLARAERCREILSADLAA